MSDPCQIAPRSLPSRRGFLTRALGASAGMAIGSLATNCGRAARRPNLVLIITDDQGWGDLSLAGNPVLQTPHTDSIAAQGMRFDNFHVCPVCAPTRASVMTGRYHFRTGVVDTYKGRAMMHADEVTVAELLRDAGYRTGIFGKWHLGDNHPMRPQDQGFQEVLIHMGGGIGQPADPPDNHYQDPMLQENGEWKRFEGYCTDIFTDAAMRFMEAHRAEPFFVYLATNAPHTPLEVPDAWVEEFRGKGVDENVAKLYAMVKNLDDNVGRVMQKLDALGLAEDTLLLFMTDNGAGGPRRFNAGLRDIKGTVYEGGIRVPLLVRWPGKVAPGSRSERLTAHLDLLPTLCEAAGAPLPAERAIDGRSLLPLLEGRSGAWPERTLFTQWHRGDAPRPRDSAAVLTDRYKLVLKPDLPNGRALFDLKQDPGETKDLSEDLPVLATELTRRYDQWLKHVSATRGYAPPRISVGAPEENPTTLTRQDWRGERAGWTEAGGAQGYWEVEVRRGGTYNVRLRTLATEAPGTAWFRMGEVTGSAPLAAGETAVTLEGLRLPKGPGRVEAWIDDGTTTNGVWYVDLEYRG